MKTLMCCFLLTLAPMVTGQTRSGLTYPIHAGDLFHYTIDMGPKAVPWTVLNVTHRKGFIDSLLAVDDARFFAEKELRHPEYRYVNFRWLTPRGTLVQEARSVYPDSIKAEKLFVSSIPGDTATLHRWKIIRRPVAGDPTQPGFDSTMMTSFAMITRVFDTTMDARTLKAVEERIHSPNGIEWIQLVDSIGIMRYKYDGFDGECKRAVLEFALVSGRMVNHAPLTMNFLPCTEGDLFQYRHYFRSTNSRETVTIHTDTMRIGTVAGGRSYFIPPDPIKRYFTTLHIRADSIGMYAYEDGEDLLLLPAAIASGITSPTTGWFGGGDGLRNILGDSVATCSFTDQYTHDEGTRIVWAQGFGVIEAYRINILGADREALIWARIGGVEYGTRETDTVLSVSGVDDAAPTFTIFPSPVSIGGTATITFSIQRAGQVTARLIDCLGRERPWLQVPQWFDPGVHDMALDARMLGIAQGPVNLQLFTPDGVMTRRVMLVR